MLNYKVLWSQKFSLLWAIIIIVLCNVKLPQNDGGEGFFFIGFDKLAHLGFFYVLCVLLFYGKINLQQHYGFRFLTIIKVVLITAVIGGGIELLQWKVFTYRAAEWWDFVCDMIGALMGVFSFVIWHQSKYNLHKV